MKNIFKSISLDVTKYKEMGKLGTKKRFMIENESKNERRLVLRLNLPKIPFLKIKL